MKMKRVLSVTLVAAMMLFTSCSQPNTNTGDSSGAPATESQAEQAAQDVIKVGYLTDTAGLGDQAFNDAINAGVMAADAANANIEATVVTPKDAGSLESTLRTLARDGNELIVVGASSLEEATLVVSKEFPDTKFIQIDGQASDLPNVMSAQFKEQEAAYLVGAFAGLMSDGKVGYISGVRNPVLKRFEAGFVEGAKAVGKTDADILVVYTNSFSDPALGKETATAMAKNGAKFIFTCAGACNLGVFEAANENDFIPLGAATGQFDKSDKIMASHVKSVDTLVENLITAYAKDKSFTAGITKNGLSENGVDIRFNPKNEELGVKIPQDVMDKITSFRDKIISGEIQVPDTVE